MQLLSNLLLQFNEMCWLSCFIVNISYNSPPKPSLLGARGFYSTVALAQNHLQLTNNKIPSEGTEVIAISSCLQNCKSFQHSLTFFENFRLKSLHIWDATYSLTHCMKTSPPFNFASQMSEPWTGCSFWMKIWKITQKHWQFVLEEV